VGRFDRARYRFVDQQGNEPWRHSFLFAPPKNWSYDYLESLHEKGIGIERELNASNWTCRRYLI
jgi:hypothetical protein